MIGDKKKKIITITIETDTLAIVKKLAKKEKRSVSSMTNLLIDLGMEVFKQNNN